MSNPELEGRLRAALQAKATAVTPAMLTQPPIVADTQLIDSQSDAGITVLNAGVVELPTGGRSHSRWFAPLLAAAAVLVVAAGAATIVTAHGQRDTPPVPPASHQKLPTPSPTPSGPRPSVSSSGPTGQLGGGPALLSRGPTGSRDDVPWSAVSAGWRLVQPLANGTGKSSNLYLYDPAGGRYLITDELPAGAILTAWSPDGTRAMLQTYGDSDRFQQVDLHSGKLLAAFSQYLGSFVGYTQPRGLAVLVRGQVQGTERLLRYSPDGAMQLAYPPLIDGVGPLHTEAFYTPDGTQFVTSAGNYSVLLSNDGTLSRRYPLPNQSVQSCQPMRWWTAGVFLESCSQDGPVSARTSLYLQPLSGAAGVLVDRNSATSMGYFDAWPLSNGDVLLSITSGCGSAGYDIQHPDGTIVPLKLPAGVPAPGTIINMSGDLATFLIGTGCGGSPNSQLLDYDMVTGQAFTLNGTGSGVIVNFPGQS